MIKLYHLHALILLVLAIGCSAGEQDKTAQHHTLSGVLEIKQSRSRPAAPGGNSAVYLSIHNGTSQADTVVGVQTEIAQAAEIHESYITDEGLSGMRPASNLAIAPGDSLVFKPGGLHIMLMNVSNELSYNDSLEIILQFAQVGPKTIMVPVRQ